MIREHDLLTNTKTQRIFASLTPTKRIVDVGCGIRPCPAFECEEYVCIEPHHEYAAMLHAWEAPGKVTVIQGEAEALADQPRKETTVLLLDVIEHMEKERGERIRDLMQEFAHAVIFTPLGWYEQGDTNPDPWGLNGGHWQKHRSAWFPENFSDWQVTAWPRWHAKKKIGAILALR